MRSQIIAKPKLVTPPPPNIQAKQAMRFTTSVALFTVEPQENNFRYIIIENTPGLVHTHAHADKIKRKK